MVNLPGDLNFYFNDPRQASVCWFTEQHDVHYHTLDVVITRGVSSIIWGTTVIVDSCLYDPNGNEGDDHFGIKVTLACSKPTEPRKEITLRRFRDVALIFNHL